MSSLRIVLFAVAGLAFAGLAAVTAMSMIDAPRNQDALFSEPVAGIGGPFQLVDQNGRAVTEADFSDKPKVIYFGFTFCPEICPTTLFELSNLLEELGPAADNLHVLFITVDPERDTPEMIGGYVGAFSDRILGLSGTQDEVDAAVAAYRVYAARVPLENGGYTMDHTASVFLMNAQNQLVGTIAYGEAHDTALAKLRRLAGAGAGS
ncbi:MAG: SCO family protein [Hyphomicrobiaceae bacterium]|nr:SCO family protein [Hyphomicrobiaceae bacterium]